MNRPPPRQGLAVESPPLAWLFAGLLCAAAACTPAEVDDDDGSQDVVVGDDDDSAEPAAGDVWGVVTEVAGEPIFGAQVQLGAHQTATSEDGRFQLGGVVVAQGLQLRVTRPGYSSFQQSVEVRADASVGVQVFLQPSLALSLADVSAGGLVSYQHPPGGDPRLAAADGLTLEFLEGDFLSSSGGAIKGSVDIAVSVLGSAEAILAAPGAMLALDEDGNEVALESFGMVEVNLSQNGEPVTFSGTAGLRIPLAGAAVTEGTPLGLWTFDEQLGYWLQEGEGVTSQDGFVAEVSHFTWWNADVPLLDRSCISGVLETPGGEPAAGMPVVAWGLDYLGVSNATSAADGSFCVAVKRGASVRLSGVGPVGADLFSWQIPATAPALSGACGDAICADLGSVALSDLGVDDDGDGFSELAGDCDDGNAARYPGAADPYGDGLDSNCDGSDGVDNDGDQSAASSGGGPDCDDEAAAVHPGAAELCDGIDNDCDGSVDEDPDDISSWFGDGDGDGYGEAGDVVLGCSPPAGYVADSSDCDDGDAAIYPGAGELCDAIDQDCDGTDQDPDSTDAGLWYGDGDGDGAGDPSVTATGCIAPEGFVATAGDCDDLLDWVHPGAAETCNGVDENCDGSVDEGAAAGSSTWFADADGDGYGVPTPTTVACAPPPGFAASADDCDDADPVIYPGAPESCSSAVDSNCDGSVQAADADGDGHAACEDCNDNDPLVYPGAAETCDGIDSDCDGSLVDFFLDTDADLQPDCVDLDDDGDGSADVDDCGPLDATVFPGAPELCDGIDSNCDAQADSCGLQLADASIYGEGSGHNLAHAVAAGDFNGDGFDDVAVGSPGSSLGAPFAGAVHIIYGPLAGVVPLAQADAVGIGEYTEDRAGSALAACDLDGDGTDELIVGAYAYDGVGQASGAVYVLQGPVVGTIPLSQAAARIDGAAAGDWAGWSLACAGDMDGDAREDLLVGAYRSDLSAADAGAAYLLHGPLSGVLSVTGANSVLMGVSAQDHAGYSVAAAGDVNGDGHPDLLIGAPGGDGVFSAQGAAYVVTGPLPATVPLSTATASISGAAEDESLGWAVAGAGDLDGDGFDDIVVGSPGAASLGVDTGAVSVFYGPISGPVGVSAASVVVAGAGLGDRLGLVLCGPCDVNGDLSPDLLAAAPLADPDGIDSGLAYLFQAPLLATELPALADHQYQGIGIGDHTGASLACGDLDGDGLGDLILGAPYHDGTGGDAGVAYVQFGSSVP